MSTTSLKLPEDVKRLAVVAAEQQGVSPHAFMVEAIRSAATRTEQRARFVAEAVAAREETIDSGKAHDAGEVHDYLRARAQGKAKPKPKAKSWRE